MTCDLDKKETPATTSVEIGYGKRRFVLDLCAKHQEEVETKMQSFISAASGTRRPAVHTTTRRPRERRARPETAPTSPSLAEIRAWAKTQGYQVADRGRIAAEVTAAYEAAVS
jgi:hypothetical protein